jgi:amino acid adenylation domain-containing protein
MEESLTLSPVKQALREQLLSTASLALGRLPEIPLRPNRDSAPLSFAQHQMWVMDQMTPGNPAYNLSIGFRLGGPLDVRALEASFNEVIKRHEVLRTTFSDKDGEPFQFIHPELKLSIEVTKLECLDKERCESRLQALVSKHSIKPFNLARLPLLRVSLFELGAVEHVLLVNAHHIVADGLSVQLLLEELATFYCAFTRGSDPHPLELDVQYADFALWERQSPANEGAYADQIGFWQKQLGGSLPVMELPADKPRPTLQSFKGSSVFLSVPGALAQDLISLGAREGCTLFMTFLAGFQVLLQRYSGAEDIVIGTPVGARTRSELEPLIGDFLNMAALRCDLSGNPSFIELLRRSRNTALDAFSNSDLPFGAMVKHLKFERDPGRNPIFQVMLEVSSTTTPAIGDLEVHRFNFDPEIAQFDLSLHLWKERDDYVGRFEYCTDLFYRETIERLSANFQRLLRAIVKEPHQKIWNLPILEPSETDQMLTEWNDTSAEFPVDLLLPQLFESQVARAPQRIALRIGGIALSYEQLDKRANRIAQALRSQGVSRGQRVGLCLERSIDMVAAALGILKAGAAYVPLDPSLPEQRLRFIADDAQLTLLMASTAQTDLFSLPRERRLLLDADAEDIDSAPENPLPIDALSAQPGDPAYIIYTSGSTGQPKGVVIPHRAVVNFLTSMAREPGFTADDVLLAVTTLSFDIAVLELYLPLTLGASVVIATHDEAIDGHALATLLEGHHVTVMQATPVTWRLLLEAGWTPRTSFKALVGGEAMPKDLADRLLETHVQLWNMYGPTETTVWSTCGRVVDTSKTITIGKPIANTVVRILDQSGGLCPIGVPGELCIGGAGVSLGYWNRPELTTARFITDPFGTLPGATLYRTGDRARWCSDGTIEHLGRFDFQIKLRGYRIEVGEIEASVAQHPLVREVAVIAREEVPGDKRLIAYVVAEDPTRDLPVQLRKLLRATLPEYMVPAHFVMLKALPRTHNGKLDRAALPSPSVANGCQEKAVAGPRTTTEEMVMGVFRGVLGRSDFGVFDSFFDLDGNSLMAARIILQLRARSRRDLQLRLLFERQTAAELAEAIDAIAFLDRCNQPCPVAGNRMEIEL